MALTLSINFSEGVKIVDQAGNEMELHLERIANGKTVRVNLVDSERNFEFKRFKHDEDVANVYLANQLKYRQKKIKRLRSSEKPRKAKRNFSKSRMSNLVKGLQ